MATDLSRSRYQGIVIPDDRMQIWTAETTVEQVGPHAGQPVPGASNAGSLALQSLRSDVSIDPGLEIRAQRGGLPGLGAAPNAATVIWREVGDDDTAWFGYDPPMAVQPRWQPLGPSTDSGDPRACVSASSAIVASTWDTGSAFKVAVRGLAETSWDLVHTGPSGSNYEPGCALATDADGAVWLAFADHNDLTETWNITVQGVSLNGSTAFVFPDETVRRCTLPTSYNTYSTGSTKRIVRSLAMAINGDEWLLLISFYQPGSSFDYRVVQYASRDGGHNFDLVDDWPDADTSQGGYPSVTVAPDGYHVVFIQTEPTATYADIVHRRVATAYQPIRTAESHAVDTDVHWAVDKIFGGAGCGIVYDKSGVLYVFGVSDSTTQNGLMAVSTDGGINWTNPYEDTNEAWFVMPTASTYRLNALGSTVWKGEVYVITGTEDNFGVALDTLHAWKLGGYTRWCMPPAGGLDGWLVQRAAWTDTYVPIGLPTDMGWTNVSGTVTSETITGGFWTLTQAGGGAAGSRNVRRTPTLHAGTVGGLMVQLHQVDVVDASSALRIEMMVGTAGTAARHVRVVIYNDRIEVDEFTAVSTPVNLASVAHDGVLIGFRCVVVDDAIRVEFLNFAAIYTPCAFEVALNTDGLGSYTNGATRIDVIANVAAGDTMRIGPISYNALFQPEYRHQRARDQVNPTDLFGRPLSSLGTYIHNDAVVRADAGPARRGDEWTISTAYDHGVTNLLDPSPRTGWRGQAVTGTKYIALRWSEVGNDRLGSDVMALVFVGSNLARVSVALHSSSGGWGSAKVADLHMSGLHWTRAGTTIIPGMGGAALMMRQEEFVDAVFSDSEDPLTNIPRVIRRSTEGRWDLNSRPARLHLADVTGTEPTSGTEGNITPRVACLLVSLAGGSYDGVRIGLLDPDVEGTPLPPNNEWECGTLLPGWLLVHPEYPSWGRVLEHEALTDVVDRQDGSSRSRTYGRTRRTMTINWSDGVDTLGATIDSDDPGLHYLDITSGDPIALARTTAWQVDGIVATLSGAHRCVAMLEHIEPFADGESVQVLNRRHQVLYGRIVTPVSLESVQGDEGFDEVFRITRLTAREEL